MRGTALALLAVAAIAGVAALDGRRRPTAGLRASASESALAARDEHGGGELSAPTRVALRASLLYVPRMASRDGSSATDRDDALADASLDFSVSNEYVERESHPGAGYPVINADAAEDATTTTTSIPVFVVGTEGNVQIGYPHTFLEYFIAPTLGSGTNFSFHSMHSMRELLRAQPAAGSVVIFSTQEQMEVRLRARRHRMKRAVRHGRVPARTAPNGRWGKTMLDIWRHHNTLHVPLSPAGCLVRQRDDRLEVRVPLLRGRPAAERAGRPRPAAVLQAADADRERRLGLPRRVPRHARPRSVAQRLGRRRDDRARALPAARHRVLKRHAVRHGRARRARPPDCEPLDRRRVRRLTLLPQGTMVTIMPLLCTVHMP